MHILWFYCILLKVSLHYFFSNKMEFHIKKYLLIKRGSNILEGKNISKFSTVLFLLFSCNRSEWISELNTYRVEAAWKLSRWDLLENYLASGKFYQNKNTPLHSWKSVCFSLIFNQGAVIVILCLWVLMGELCSWQSSRFCECIWLWAV